LIGIRGSKREYFSLISTMVNQIALALKNAAEHQRVQSLAITDDLTGLHNRRALHETLHKEIRRSKRYRKPLSLLMLDIDGFKKINDTFGHQAGDEVLKSVAAHLQEVIRETDFLARYGGDEFAVILPETKAREATVLAERLKKAVVNYPISAGGDHRSITLSVGVADISNERTDSEEELISRADRVLYLSKGNGGNLVKLHCNPC
jgi:diguanylate cyclase (GGDEF)-like protein